MTDRDFSRLADFHRLGDDPVPDVVVELAAGRAIELAWRNESGGLTFRFADEFVKWNPRSSGIDLQRERDRLDWLAHRHPVPPVVSFGSDDDAQWLVTVAIPGGSAVGDTWRARRSEAIHAIATGLRAVHAVPIDDVPSAMVGRNPGSDAPPPRSGRGHRSTTRCWRTVTPARRTP